MASEAHHRRVVRVLRVLGLGIVRLPAHRQPAEAWDRDEPVIPARDSVVLAIESNSLVRRVRGVAQIPQSHRLVLPVGYDVSSVALGRQESNSLRVADKRARCASSRHGTTIPHLDVLVVRARKQQVRRGLVGKGDRVHVCLVCADAEHRSPRLDVVHAHRSLCATRNDLTRVVRESERPNLGRVSTIHEIAKDSHQTLASHDLRRGRA